MIDMSQTIIAKSDQLNSDDLMGGSIDIKITGVSVVANEQPTSIHYEGDNNKPWKPCKSMCRVMVAVWGLDGQAYIGQSLRLYRDPDVKWGGANVGGIRITHMTGIDSKKIMPLTVTRGNKKPYTVEPLVVAQPKTMISSDQFLELHADIMNAGSPDDLKEQYTKANNLRGSMTPEQYAELVAAKDEMKTKF